MLLAAVPIALCLRAGSWQWFIRHTDQEERLTLTFGSGTIVLAYEA
jgi:hypothetical protein